MHKLLDKMGYKYNAEGSADFIVNCFPVWLQLSHSAFICCTLLVLHKSNANSSLLRAVYYLMLIYTTYSAVLFIPRSRVPISAIVHHLSCYTQQLSVYLSLCLCYQDNNRVLSLLCQQMLIKEAASRDHKSIKTTFEHDSETPEGFPRDSLPRCFCMYACSHI